MVDPRIEKLAKICVHYSVDVKPKDQVVIEELGELALPLINEIYKECLLCDAYPLIMRGDFAHIFFGSTEYGYTFHKYAKEHQLKFASPVHKFALENIDVLIQVLFHPNPKGLTNIDPSKAKAYAESRRELKRIYLERLTIGKLRRILLPYPISAQAQEAGMSLEEYEDFVYNSCLIDKEDPIAEWKKIHNQQEKICEFLNKIDEFHIKGEDTDLTFSVKGRKWINCDGRLNMPDGEVFTGPIENSTNGMIRFTFPGIDSGREVEDIQLIFRDGKVVKASAAKGNELLQQLLKVDGANRIGEVAIGTNYGITKFTKNILFDEKMGGTIHIALGASYPQSGGLNKSGIHWDILKDMKKRGEIYADGKLFYKNGMFLI